LQIKITYNLARYAAAQRERHRGKYATNRFIGLVDTWCRLKAIAGQSGVIQGWQKQLADTSKVSISTTVLYRRLDALQREGWLTYVNDRITLKSWGDIHHMLGLPYKKEFFSHTTTTDRKQRFYWVYLAEAMDNKARQAYSVIKKVTKNHAVKAEVYNAIKQDGRIDTERCESDAAYFLQSLQGLYKSGFVHGGSKSYETLTLIRPFTTRSATGMGKAYNEDFTPTGKLGPQEKARYSMLGTYIKKAMARAMVAESVPISTLESDARERNPHCRVMWNKWNHTTFHAFCDDIRPLEARTDRAAAKMFKIPEDTATSGGTGRPNL
jgi:hypothetical protein